MTQFAPLVGDRVAQDGAGAAVYSGVTTFRNRDGWVLEGAARYVLDADRADRLAVVAPAGVFVVEAKAVICQRVSTIDPMLHLTDLRFNQVHVADENRIASDIERAWHIALTGMAITIVGACQRIVDLAVEHLKQRYQFGVPIGSFQHSNRAADMYVAIERARAMSYLSALTIAADDPRRRLFASMAKAAAGEAQSLVVQYGLQCFGAMGLTWENDLQFAIKRAKAGN